MAGPLFPAQIRAICQEHEEGQVPGRISTAHSHLWVQKYALNDHFTIPRFDFCCLYFLSCLYAFLVGDCHLEMVRWLVTLSQSDAFLVS